MDHDVGFPSGARGQEPDWFIGAIHDLVCPSFAPQERHDIAALELAPPVRSPETRPPFEDDQDLFLREMRVVRVSRLSGRNLPETQSQPLRACLATQPSPVRPKALLVADVVEFGSFDVHTHGAYCAQPVFGRIDHIGVAVEDLDEAIRLYGERLGMPLQHRETVEEQGVEAVLLGVGESHVELLRPLGPDTAVGKFLERSGPGLHHVAYGTDDIESALDAVRGAGLALIDEQPRTGIRGSRVAFLHPKSTGGVLTELVEAPEGH